MNTELNTNEIGGYYRQKCDYCDKIAVREIEDMEYGENKLCEEHLASAKLTINILKHALNNDDKKELTN